MILATSAIRGEVNTPQFIQALIAHNFEVDTVRSVLSDIQANFEKNKNQNNEPDYYFYTSLKTSLPFKCSCCQKDKVAGKTLFVTQPTLTSKSCIFCYQCIKKVLASTINYDFLYVEPLNLVKGVQKTTDKNKEIIKQFKNYYKEKGIPSKEVNKMLVEFFDFPDSLNAIGSAQKETTCFSCDTIVKKGDSYVQFQRKSTSFKGKGKRPRFSHISEPHCANCFDSRAEEWIENAQMFTEE